VIGIEVKVLCEYCCLARGTYRNLLTVCGFIVLNRKEVTIGLT